jgi:Ca2+/H+ antiporter
MLPVLVCVSGILDGSTPLLIFPFYSAFAVVFAVIIVNYISIEVREWSCIRVCTCVRLSRLWWVQGAANYFRGVSLVVVYCLFIVGFYFHKDADEPPSTHASVLLA